MTVLTLITDWGLSDYMLAALKGSMLSALPELKMVDISHDITSYEGLEAAFLLQHSYRHYPAGTIHYIGVGISSGDQHPLMLVKAQGQFFLWKNNGFLGLLFSEYDQAVHLPYSVDDNPIHFLPQLVEDIASGVALHSLGVPIEPLLSLPQQPLQQPNTIVASILHVDKFGNVITNVSQDIFKAIGRGRPFTILLNSNQYKINTLSEGYSTVVEGSLLAFFNTLDLLELAVNQGNVCKLYRLQKGRSTITIHFEAAPN